MNQFSISYESTLCIGNIIEVRPVAQLTPNRWKADSTVPFQGWSIELISKGPAKIITGEPLPTWIIDTIPASKQMVVSNSNFGFLPISDRMRPRYISSLVRLVTLTLSPDKVELTDAEAISETKGMFTRCLRRDQWDWFSVFVALGRPQSDDLRAISKTLGEIGAELRHNRLETAQIRLEELGSRWLNHTILHNAIEIIKNSGTNEPLALVIDRHKNRNRKIEQKSNHTMRASTKEKLSDANQIHTALLDVLGETLSSIGFNVETNQFIDAYTRLKTGPAIFEAKSITTTNELSQVRHAVSQLYEYRYLHHLENASLWLVLSEAPNEKWVIDYLELDRGIHVIWLDNEGKLDGPCIDRLIESGSEALRRGTQPPTVK